MSKESAEDLYSKFKSENDPVSYSMSKSNIDFVAPKESTEPDEEEIKHVREYELAEKKKSLWDQLRLNGAIRLQAYEDRFKPQPPAALDEEEARFLEEKRQKQLEIEKKGKEQIKEELRNYEEELKKLSEMPQEDLENTQQKLFQPATFSKKKKVMNLEKIDLQIEVSTKKRKEKEITTKSSKKKKKKKLNSNSLVSYGSDDSD
eukprot:gene11979-5380_t